MIEGYINILLIMAGVEVQKEASSDEIVLRSKAVMGKCALLAREIFKNSVNYTTSTKAYTFLDSYVHFGQRWDDIVVISAAANKRLNENAIVPVKEAVLLCYNKLTLTYTFIINEISFDSLKNRLVQLKEGSEYLKEATFYVRD